VCQAVTQYASAERAAPPHSAKYPQRRLAAELQTDAQRLEATAAIEQTHTRSAFVTNSPSTEISGLYNSAVAIEFITGEITPDLWVKLHSKVG